ncbi:hypothetical protein OIY81_2847 [Cryptosporidium canis]|uniref:Uncharacterized protein n=1 Tax=Cryptosporidium canis TaxID=195482 RepID=A0ABQ8P9G5_9CRYT|nr:hypothetical protein OIY81_2847 [Cryptosporidium canis]KAJ1610076.1 hypothetical protein OJ252_2004 [Cryptosporidium canis]
MSISVCFKDSNLANTQICRCFTCGLLQYTGVVIKNEDETDETSSKSHSPESIPQSGERELDKQDGELIYRFGAAETKGMGNLENNKKLVLEELKEKYQGPKLPHETHNTPKYTTNNSTETLNPNPFLN